MNKENIKIIVTTDGPYQVVGKAPIRKEIISSDKNGDSCSWKEGEKYPEENGYCLCRCGNSKHKPFCDSTHNNIPFDGTETASVRPYEEMAEKTEGPSLALLDLPDLCSSARFCDPDTGVWQLTRKSADDKCRTRAIEEACNCPSGRLVIHDKKTGKAIEPEFSQSISIIEDPAEKVSGPIWVKGAIQIESESGKHYEKRNRVTLCRCGKSRNKPFCDAEHVNVRFNDGDKSLK